MRHAARISIILAIAALLGAAPSQDTVLSSIDWNGKRLSLSHMRSHENLTLVLIRSSDAEEAVIAPATVAFKKRWLRVGEGRTATVNMLRASNAGRQPVLIQDGTRFHGGRQDRIAGIPLVVPPASRSFPVPSYCVERSRWHGGTTFASSRSPALAPKAVRYAAKVSKNQGEVWSAVARVKEEAAKRFGVPSKTSNLNEMLDHPKVRRMVDPFTRELGKVAEEDANSVGIAVLVGGRLEEIRIYPDHALFTGLYPEVLRSYGLHCKLTYGREKEAASLKAIENRIRASIGKTGKVVRRDRWNSLRVARMDDGVCSEARYKGKTVLLEWLSAPRTP